MSSSSTTADPETSPRPARALVNQRALTILFVDDSPGDVELVRQALLGYSVKLWTASDGVNAMRLLEGSGGEPDLILLDLNMPRMDGRALLGRIKSSPELGRIPVIVLTCSNAPLDVMRAYDLHANCYITKPHDFDGFERVIHRLVDFWTETALPTSR